MSASPRFRASSAYISELGMSPSCTLLPMADFRLPASALAVRLLGAPRSRAVVAGFRSLAAGRVCSRILISNVKERVRRPFFRFAGIAVGVHVPFHSLGVPAEKKRFVGLERGPREHAFPSDVMRRPSKTTSAALDKLDS